MRTVTLAVKHLMTESGSNEEEKKNIIYTNKPIRNNLSARKRHVIHPDHRNGEIHLELNIYKSQTVSPYIGYITVIGLFPKNILHYRIIIQLAVDICIGNRLL